ncbi:MAG: Hsp70 family protein [Treponema sp.]|jgi:hypothetical protein|nr:Hsp70 family protein [Treponema sp.]
MTGSIGIKQANGEFYSILDLNSAVKRRLVLTTVHDDQKSVQIDLYSSLSKAMTDAMYIGSIVINKISAKTKGEASIEMTLSIGQDGSLNAAAVDLGNPSNRHSLTVSLQSFEDDDIEYLDFDLENKESERKFPFNILGNVFKKNKGSDNTRFDNDNGRRFPWLIVIITGLLLVVLCLALWFFLLRDRFFEPEQTTDLSVTHEPVKAAKIVQPLIVEGSSKNQFFRELTA